MSFFNHQNLVKLKEKKHRKKIWMNVSKNRTDHIKLDKVKLT